MMKDDFFDGELVVFCEHFDEYKRLIDFINTYNRNKILARKMKTISHLLNRVWDDVGTRCFWIENKTEFMGSTKDDFECDIPIVTAKKFLEDYLIKKEHKTKAIYLGAI